MAILEFIRHHRLRHSIREIQFGRQFGSAIHEIQFGRQFGSVSVGSLGRLIELDSMHSIAGRLVCHLSDLRKCMLSEFFVVGDVLRPFRNVRITLNAIVGSATASLPGVPFGSGSITKDTLGTVEAFGVYDD